jgi:hypothetical protein
MSATNATSMPDLTVVDEIEATTESALSPMGAMPAAPVLFYQPDRDNSENEADKEEEEDDEPVLLNLASLKELNPKMNSLMLEQTQPSAITHSEFEDKLKKLVRNKSLCRSLRKAKFVYWRNRRSQSLEDLSAEDRAQFSLSGSSRIMLRLSRNSSNSGSKTSLAEADRSENAGTDTAAAKGGLSDNSSCSSSVVSLVSDISSSYFHELNDWSPEFSDSDEDSDSDGSGNGVIFTDMNSNFLNVAFVSLNFFSKYNFEGLFF